MTTNDTEVLKYARLGLDQLITRLRDRLAWIESNRNELETETRDVLADAEGLFRDRLAEMEGTRARIDAPALCGCGKLLRHRGRRSPRCSPQAEAAGATGELCGCGKPYPHKGRPSSTCTPRKPAKSKALVAKGAA